MKRIGLTHRLAVDAATGELRDCLDIRWTAFLGAAGLVPVPTPSGVDPSGWLAAVGPLDGLVLTGGNDLVSADPNPVNERRQEFELALLEAHGNRPVLGVCRGCQLLGWKDGFTLEKVTGHVRTRHPLQATARAGRWGALDGAQVNSFHGWSLTGRGRTMEVVLKAPDGRAEAIASPTRPVVGIMWHPEREETPAPSDLALFKEFFA